MTTQPEALRLADAIDPLVRQFAPDHLTSNVAAAELRRLHAELEAMTQCAKNHDAARTKYLLLNAELLSALRAITAVSETKDDPSWNAVKDCARAAIAKATGEQK